MPTEMFVGTNSPTFPRKTSVLVESYHTYLVVVERFAKVALSIFTAGVASVTVASQSSHASLSDGFSYTTPGAVCGHFTKVSVPVATALSQFVTGFTSLPYTVNGTSTFESE